MYYTVAQTKPVGAHLACALAFVLCEYACKQFFANEGARKVRPYKKVFQFHSDFAEGSSFLL
ncbi:hypothetical protein CKA38_07145 [Ereboglobus luteus]|uniref:Uncharacterized protein n=1 Tax=Ereboglobus luteus TaxID=1796921 RepID=A0A2U8E2P2_9BACT|nr:hypothetical protein CKA38_07145 [Ereboglobus luteus]